MSGRSTPARRELSDAERARELRQSGLRTFTRSTARSKPPRFPVKCLSDEDLTKEIENADGDFLKALHAEVERRAKSE